MPHTLAHSAISSKQIPPPSGPDSHRCLNCSLVHFVSSLEGRIVIHLPWHKPATTTIPPVVKEGTLRLLIKEATESYDDYNDFSFRVFCLFSHTSLPSLWFQDKRVEKSPFPLSIDRLTKPLFCINSTLVLNSCT